MFIVEMTNSPFFKSTHYVQVVIGARIIQRSKKTATKFDTREEAQKVVDAMANNPNKFTATVAEI